MDKYDKIYIRVKEYVCRPWKINMAASNCFTNLSAVFAQLESAGAHVHHAALDHHFSSSGGEHTAEISVDIPLLTDESRSEPVTMRAENATIEDGALSVELSVTVSSDEPELSGKLEDGSASTGRRELDSPDRTETAGVDATDETVPAYKNPAALRRVYEECASFREMTDALGVDVTPETVRRHMIDCDIHDPHATRPESYVNAEAKQTADAAVQEQPTDEGEKTAKSATTAEKTTKGVANERVDTDSNTDKPQSDPQTHGSTEGRKNVATTAPTNAITDGGDKTVEKAALGERSARGSTPLSDVVPAGHPAAAQQIPSSEFGETLTVEGLTDAINRSKTVREVAQYLGTDREPTKQLLATFSLIEFVSHRLAVDRITLSSDEVIRRIESASG